jgi:tRNA(fMet)-specific endonuclease VapC
MKYLLDTNVVSEPTKQTPSAALLRRIGEHASELAIASITWHELLHGWERMPAGRKRERIGAYLADTRGILPVLPYDERAAEWHARERVRLRKRGKEVPYVDSQIAAVAVVNELILVTANTKDFAPFAGLAVENWLR